MWPTGSVSADGASSATQDCSSRAAMRAQRPVDETRTGRVEFDRRLFDGGVDGGVRVDAGAQQLVGAEPQQVEQHRRRCGRAGRFAACTMTASSRPSARHVAVGEFGGEGGVTAGDVAFAQQRGQHQVGVGVALGDGAQHVEGRLAGGVERLARWPPSPCGRVTWRSRSRRGGRRGPSPRPSSASCRAAGPHRAAPGRDDVPTCTPPRSTRITPGGNGSRSSCSSGASPDRASPAGRRSWSTRRDWASPRGSVGRPRGRAGPSAPSPRRR